MPFGTSDGRTFDDEFDHAMGQLDTMHLETYGPGQGLPSGGTQDGDSPIYKYRVKHNAEPYDIENPNYGRVGDTFPVVLDQMRPGEVYDDTQTDQEYDRRLIQWGQNYTGATGRKFDNPNFNDRMPEYLESLPEANQMNKEGWAYNTGDLPPLIRRNISYKEEDIINKPMNESFKDGKEKEAVANLLLEAHGDPFELAALRQKRGVLVPGKAERTLPLATVATHIAQGLIELAKAPGKAYKEGMSPEEETKVTTNLALTMIMGPAPIAAKVVDGTLGSIAGISAKTASTEKLNLANMLEGRGATPEHIWDKTGYFRGIDNKWRFELPNSDLAIFRNPRYEEVGSTRKYEASPVTEVFDYPELFAAYPSLKNYTVKIDNTIPELGLHHAGTKTITLNLDKIKANGQYNPETIMLHELQHAIQTKEKFVMGRGGEENQLDVLSRAIMNKIDSIKNPAEAAELATKIKDTLVRAKEVHGNKIGQELYRRDPAEQEANTVMRRSTWTPEERALESPQASTERYIREGGVPIPVVTPNEALWAKTNQPSLWMSDKPLEAIKNSTNIEHLNIRLGQLTRDKAATKKTGYDVESSDYSHYNAQIKAIRDRLKELK